jgi:hypothetical protein
MRLKTGINNGTRKCVWASLLWNRGWVLVGLHRRWRLSAFLPLPSKPVNRVYLGPLELEWTKPC